MAFTTFTHFAWLVNFYGALFSFRNRRSQFGWWWDFRLLATISNGRRRRWPSVQGQVNLFVVGSHDREWAGEATKALSQLVGFKQLTVLTLIKEAHSFKIILPCHNFTGRVRGWSLKKSSENKNSLIPLTIQFSLLMCSSPSSSSSIMSSPSSSSSLELSVSSVSLPSSSGKHPSWTWKVKWLHWRMHLLKDAPVDKNLVVRDIRACRWLHAPINRFYTRHCPILLGCIGAFPFGKNPLEQFAACFVKNIVLTIILKLIQFVHLDDDLDHFRNLFWNHSFFCENIRI